MQDAIDPHHQRRWLILVLLGIAQLMVVLDVTIVNIAMPSAQDALHFSDNDRQWIVTAYALAFGGLLLVGGRLGDLFGRKRTFVIGLAGFAGASALGGLADSFETLVAARALQGVFGALLAPSALSLLTTTFTEPKERAKAFGVYSAIAAGGGTLGLLLGGVLTEYLSWRWCMYVNLALALPAAIGALALLHNQPRAGKGGLDIPGTLTASLGLFALVYGFSQAESRGWGDGVTLGFLAAGVVLLAAFVAIQRRVEHPLLPLRVITDRNRAATYLAIGIAGAGMFAVFLFLTYYLQRTLGFSPVTTGVAFLPMTGSIMIGAGVSTNLLLPRTGPRPLVLAGMLLATTGMVILTGVGVDTGYAGHVLPALIVLGLGMGVIMSSSISTATLGVRPADAGVASAMVSTTQQIGGSIGSALLSSIASTAVTDWLVGKAHTPGVAAQAAVHGYTTAFWCAAALFLTGAVVCPMLFGRDARRHVTVGEPILAH